MSPQSRIRLHHFVDQGQGKREETRSMYFSMLSILSEQHPVLIGDTYDDERHDLTLDNY